MPTNGTSADHPVRCPRCAYDLAGHIAAWTDECPMRGQCSECGLEFNWADLLNSDRIELPWLYEHARRWWNFRKLVSTAIRAFLPWWFWKRVELHYYIRPSRLASYLILPVLVFYVISAMLGLLSAIIVWAPNVGKSAPMVAVSSSRLDRPATSLDGTTLLVSREGKTATIPNAVNPTSPPKFFETEIGPILVFNELGIGGWSIQSIDAPDFPLFEFRDEWMPWQWISPDGQKQPLNLIVTGIYRDTDGRPDSFSELVIAAILDPIGMRTDLSVGPLMFSFHSDPAVNPMPIPMLGFMIVAVAIIFAAPSEWRQSRVRPIHLLRIAAYSLSPILLHFTITLFAHAWAYAGHTVWQLKRQFWNVQTSWVMDDWLITPMWLDDFATSEMNNGFIVFLAIWTPVYWWFALKRGMQLRKPFWLWFFIVIGGLLGSAAVPSAVYYLVQWLIA